MFLLEWELRGPFIALTDFNVASPFLYDCLLMGSTSVAEKVEAYGREATPSRSKALDSIIKSCLPLTDSLPAQPVAAFLVRDDGDSVEPDSI